jgi:23S rRNA (adenine2030-N6)-methyltransferase
MNYRHIYHAGNFADVFKHVVLIMLIKDLCKKDKSILFMDTHAGIGKYDLGTAVAQKTCEYEQGFLKLYDQDDSLSEYPEVINIYKNIIESLNFSSFPSTYINFLKNPAAADFSPCFFKESQAKACGYQNAYNKTSKSQEIINSNIGFLTLYPGSPWIFKALMRAQDQVILTELHKEDIITLKHNFAHDKQIAVHHTNGYAALKAFLPPKCGRGLILIDPPFEDKDEFTQVLAGLELALKRFNNGTYIIWYPIKDGIEVRKFYRRLEQLKAKNFLIREFGLTKNLPLTGLSKCGVIIINAPWQFEIELDKVINWLKKIF